MTPRRCPRCAAATSDPTGNGCPRCDAFRAAHGLTDADMRALGSLANLATYLASADADPAAVAVAAMVEAFRRGKACAVPPDPSPAPGTLPP